MGALVLYLLLGLVGLIATAQPWVGIIASYVMAVASPQTIWWYHFDGIRPVYWVLLPTLLGTAIAIARGTARLDLLLNVRVALLIAVWCCALISLLSGPYVLRGEDLGVRDAGYLFETYSKILLAGLVASAVIWDSRHFKTFAWALFLLGLYFTYWGNSMYLTGNFARRLQGPVDLLGNGPYADENNFATLIVGFVPFLWYLAISVERRWLRGVLLCATPLAWHVVFLTGSRGGLLGLIAVVIWTGFRSRRSLWFAPILIAAFAVAFVWQAGDVMKERAATIDDYRDEASAATRLEAWEAAGRMMLAHPVTGVGPGAFVRAFPSYSDHQARQAHNTYLQVGAEYGPLGGVALLSAVVVALIGLWKRLNRLRSKATPCLTPEIVAIGEATLCGLLGVFVCSMFLTLQLFEILFCLLFLASALICFFDRAGCEAKSGVQAPKAIRNRSVTTSEGDGSSGPTKS